MGPRTFQNRQALSFPDSIDTWGPPSDDKTTQNNLKIGKGCVVCPLTEIEMGDGGGVDSV